MSYRSSDPYRPAPPDQRPPGHLPAERLAELADAEPSTAEAAHLAGCADCRYERDAHRSLLAVARRARDHVAPPLTDWSALAGALGAEGLLHGSAADAAVPVAVAELPATATVRAIADAPSARRRSVPAWVARAAAALLLVTGGAVAGRASTGAPVLPWSASTVAGTDERVAQLLADSTPTPRSQEEAIALLTKAEKDYRLATQWLAEQTTTGAGVDRPEDYQRRLAVMDEVASLTGAALAQAPHDPVLNQYYLASLSAREATLRKLGTVLPAGAQINRF